jgi:CarD family transcriptional regulator
MMASADAAAAAPEDGQPAVETGTSAAAKPQVTRNTAKSSSGTARRPARSVAADMPPTPVKVGLVVEPGDSESPSEASDHQPGPGDDHITASSEESGPETGPRAEALAEPDETAIATAEEDASPSPASSVVPDAEDAEDDEDEPAAEAPERPMRVAPHHSGMRPGQHGGPTQIPRMPAKAEIFVEGDHVVYPTHGVGKVERIATEEIAGHRLELIHITFEENRMTLRVPVSKARSAGLRKLATRKMFDDALAVLKGRARIKRTMWSRRAQEYEAKINSGDPLAIAEVVRDLHRNAGQPDQSFSERQIYEAAMDRLAAELAALDKTDKPTAVTKLTDFLKTV